MRCNLPMGGWTMTLAILNRTFLDDLPIFAPPRPHKPAQLRDVPIPRLMPHEAAQPAQSPEQLQQRGMDWLACAAELQGEHAARLQGYGYACLSAARYLMRCREMRHEVALQLGGPVGSCWAPLAAGGLARLAERVAWVREQERRGGHHEVAHYLGGVCRRRDVRRVAVKERAG